MEALLLRLIDLVFFLYNLAFIARALLPWFRLSPYHPIMRFLIQITEPVLAPLRRYIRPMGTLDFTPMVAIILLMIVEQMLGMLVRIVF